ncbi:phosphoribosyltransferase family protein [Lentzea flava]|uniref:Phosphoribosyl transferase n=1 Tax=Lentzea flava TaxID=103732 RepID=A0ABQ2UTV0_9PSEU|nr:phosphoribosyltransferase family protein [Lentzea flava]MCP2197305.1 putative phosphoribosyl transferase [Lentzea flava]GGU50073.1 putative phosphoribosyl transferase [Lentzea flava]
MRFSDRTQAGRLLAGRLGELRGQDVVVLAVPRGGVPVAAEVADALGAPLDIVVVRKLGLPFQPEVATGAVGEGGVRVLDRRVQRLSGVTKAELATAEHEQRREVLRRLRRYRTSPPIPLKGRTAVVVDDGVATGATARAACQVARARGAARVLFATPVCSPEAVSLLRLDADQVVTVTAPPEPDAVGRYYDDFRQVSDAEVIRLLSRRAGPPPSGRLAVRQRSIEVPVGRVRLAGDLAVPEHPVASVVFAQAGASAGHSSRTRHVAAELNRAGVATVITGLLTREEELDRVTVVDVNLLGHRLTAVTRWARGEANHRALPVGCFGVGHGAAAALRSAADPRSGFCAVVSLTGRLDLAEPWLGRVRPLRRCSWWAAPTTTAWRCTSGWFRGCGASTGSWW